MQNFEDILKQTIDSLKLSCESGEIMGKPIIGTDGSVILPVSKISIGFVAGCGDSVKGGKIPTNVSGGGVSVTPIGFFVCNGMQKKFVRVDEDGDKWGDLLKSVVGVLKKD